MISALGRGLVRLGRRIQKPLSALEHPITAVQTGVGWQKKRRQRKKGLAAAPPPKPRRRPLGLVPPSLRRHP